MGLRTLPWRHSRPPDASTEKGKRNARQQDKAIEPPRARTAQSDVLGALALAADRLAHVSGLRTIVVQHSGLSSSGLIDSQSQGRWTVDPAQVADAVADANRLPDFRGVLVVFQGLGEVASPHRSLDSVREAQCSRFGRHSLPERAPSMCASIRATASSCRPPACQR